MNLFCDMDGVLADFDTGYEKAFGLRPSKAADNADWSLVRAHIGFYEDLPPMPDMLELWAFIWAYSPTVLTGIPYSISEAPANKKAWISRHLGNHVPVICCRSKEKSLHCRPGDILIDDWDKHRDLWESKGGIWVTHKSAEQTIQKLKQLGLKQLGL